MMEAVSLGPVSIAIEADKAVFQSYKTGVMNGQCGSKLDHGILCVGYGADQGTKYWLERWQNTGTFFNLPARTPDPDPDFDREMPT